jgi:hypothetical protein
VRPVVTQQSNAVFKLPGGDVDSDLPVVRATSQHNIPIIISTWVPDTEERAAIAAGANVELIVWGVSQPPVFVGMTPAQEMVMDVPLDEGGEERG